jgi:hypothetical protein
MAIYARALLKHSSRTIWIIFVICSDRSVHGDIFYILDLVNNLVLILRFITLNNIKGNLQLDIILVKCMQKIVLLIKKLYAFELGTREK